MTHRELADLHNMAASLEEVGKEFALTPEQLKDPNCGKYIVDRIHQIQTAYNIRKGLHDRVDFPKSDVPFGTPGEDEKGGGAAQAD